MEWLVEGSAVLSNSWDKPRCARRQAVYSKNLDGYEVQGCGRWEVGVKCYRVQMFCVCEDAREVFLEHGVGNRKRQAETAPQCTNLSC